MVMHDAPPLAYPWEFVFISSLVIFQSFETEYKNAQQKEIYSLNFAILSLIVLSPNNFIDENRFRQYSAFFFFKKCLSVNRNIVVIKSFVFIFGVNVQKEHIAITYLINWLLFLPYHGISTSSKPKRRLNRCQTKNETSLYQSVMLSWLDTYLAWGLHHVKLRFPGNSSKLIQSEFCLIFFCHNIRHFGSTKSYVDPAHTARSIKVK